MSSETKERLRDVRAQHMSIRKLGWRTVNDMHSFWSNVGAFTQIEWVREAIQATTASAEEVQTIATPQRQLVFYSPEFQIRVATGMLEHPRFTTRQRKLKAGIDLLTQSIAASDE